MPASRRTARNPPQSHTHQQRKGTTKKEHQRLSEYATGERVMDDDARRAPRGAPCLASLDFPTRPRVCAVSYFAVCAWGLLASLAVRWAWCGRLSAPPRSVVLGVRCGARLRRGRPATPDGRSIVVILSCLAACWPLVCRAWPACVLPLHLGGTDKVRPPFSWRPFLLFFVVWAPCFAFFLIHADEHAAALGAVVVAAIEVFQKLFCAAIFADAARSCHIFRVVRLMLWS